MTSARLLQATLAGALLLAGCQAIQRITSQVETGGPAPLTSLEGVAEAMRDTIAERLAGLEIERSTMLARRNAQSPEVNALNQQKVALCRELTELQRTISVEAFTTARVLRAVEERLAGLVSCAAGFDTRVRPCLLCEDPSARDACPAVRTSSRRAAPSST